ncbi:hypothetical protein HD806DRAFT_392980 [Xylariaceae sp. AK1471]|nr:hypothetical protein HD806DRAFT_392980 [Xylariaceae sp. AK1471]
MVRTSLAMARPHLPLLLLSLVLLVHCSPVSSNAREMPPPDFAWSITDFEWRTGYFHWQWPSAGGPGPPPPPTGPIYKCGQAMILLNITRLRRLEASSTVPCIEQTNDVKLANITDVSDYNGGPEGNAPPSPHWFTCDLNNQIFVYPNGMIPSFPPPDPADYPPPARNATKIRLDPVNLTFEIMENWVWKDNAREPINVAGNVPLPPLTCHERTQFEPGANFTLSSPFFVGQNTLPVVGGSVCTTGPFFISGKYIFN